MSTTNPKVQADYSKWALGCLFRELRKEVRGLYGDVETVSKWAMEALDMGSPIPTMSDHSSAYWIKKYFLPEWLRKRLPENDIISEIRRRLDDYYSKLETIPD